MPLDRCGRCGEPACDTVLFTSILSRSYRRIHACLKHRNEVLRYLEGTEKEPDIEWKVAQ